MGGRSLRGSQIKRALTPHPTRKSGLVSVTEHSINQGHQILFHDISILNPSAKYLSRNGIEANEVVLRPFNMNK
jgi:hypothetical protein